MVTSYLTGNLTTYSMDGAGWRRDQQSESSKKPVCDSEHIETVLRRKGLLMPTGICDPSLHDCKGQTNTQKEEF